MRYLNILFSTYSFVAGIISNIYIPRALRGYLYNFLGRRLLGMGIADFSEIKGTLHDFKNIAEFFSRPITESSRPLGSNIIISPCDGKILETGIVQNNNNLLVKNHIYKINELLDMEKTPQELSKGNFINIYLSPRDYHRFHTPCEGEIFLVKRIKGYCFPVNSWGQKNSKLYATNERCIVGIRKQERVVYMVIVGALAVRSIFLYKKINDKVLKGESLGCFKLGSSIVLLSNIEFNKVVINSKIKARQNI